MASARIDSRRKMAAQSFGNAANCIGEIEKNMSLFAVTRGQWSMIDAILHCLDQVGKSKISLWTWTVAEYEVQCLTRLRNDSRLTEGLLIIDGGARVKNLGLLKEWQETFGGDSVRYVVNHSKMCRIESESGFKLLLRGSMNLNFNPRFEQFDLTEGGEDFDMVEEIETELPILKNNCSGTDIYKASRVSECFEQETLAMFSGVKVWAK